VRSLTVLLVGALIALALLPAAPVAAGARHPSPSLGPGRTTLTYCHDGGVPETLQVDEPDPVPSSPVPAVVYVHGGGWVGGNSNLVPGSLVARVEAAVLSRGWVFVSIDYRLAPHYRWPAQIDDATCAVRFLRADSTALHVDAGAIGALGDSAGGQIVSLLGVTVPSSGFDGGQWANQPSSVEAVADLYGPADLTSPDWAHAALIQAYAPQVFGAPLGPGPADAPATATLVGASPVRYVTAHAAPFLIVQGADDGVVPPAQSLELAARLRAAGDDPTLVMVRNAQHGLLSVGGAAPSPTIAQLATDVVAFMVHHLRH
jgi:acetyl esterase/lipase